MELKTCSSQLCIGLRVAATRDNEMAYRLPGFLSSLLTGATWLQPDLPHFTCPLPIMVASPRRLTVGLLPDMRHFMGKCREDHLISATGKTVRVESKFMDCRFTDTPVKPLRGKVTSRIRVALQCHQHLGQAAAKQFPIEKIVGFLEALIFRLCISFYLHICIVPYNLYLVKS